MQERRLAADRLIGDREPEASHQAGRVLGHDHEGALQRAQWFVVAWRGDEQPFRHSSGIDVLIAHPLVPGGARLDVDGGVVAGFRAKLRRLRRRVGLPVAVGGRTHIAVVGPERMAGRGSRGGGVVRPGAIRVLHERRCGREIDVVPHERRRALFEQRQVRRVVLQAERRR